MASTDQDVQMWSGNDCTLHINMLNQDGTQADLSGVTDARWSLGVSATTAALITKTSGSGLTVDTVNKRLVVLLAGADTNALAGNYYHEARVTKSGVTTTVTVGAFVIEPTIH